MSYLSKNIFTFNASKKELPKDTISIYNDNNIVHILDYNILDRLYQLKKRESYIINNKKTPEEILKKTKSIVIGHGSITKAEIFQNYEKYIPMPLYFLLSFFEDGKIINKNLIKNVEYFMSAKNTTHYYLINIEELLTFLKDNFNSFLYLTYR